MRIRSPWSIFSVCLLSTPALASPEWLTAFKAKYGTDPVNPSSGIYFADRVSCTACHDGQLNPDPALPAAEKMRLINAFYDPNKSCYKRDLLKKFDPFALDHAKAVVDAINAADALDSDGDGVPNGIEIMAPRRPSYPFAPAPLGFNPGLKGFPGADPCDADTVWSTERETPPDNDADGVADIIDGCPNDSLKSSPGRCGCGLPETDTDADGVPDCVDLCPGQDDRLDANTNGVPDCAETTTFTVNSTVDSVDAVPGDGVCADGQGRCTLRAAIMEANAHPGLETIKIPAGTYTLAIPSGSESGGTTGADDAKGDLDIVSDVNIIGAGADTTVINANGIARVFQMGNGFQGTVSIANVTITGGVATGVASVYGSGYGGGVHNLFATLTMNGCVIKDNRAVGPEALGGGIYSAGDLTLINSTVYANTVNEGGAGSAYGAGVCNDFGGAATATITNCTISGNMAAGAGDQGGGLALYRGGTATLLNCTIASNGAIGGGGGIFVNNSGTLSIRNSIVADSVSGGNCSSIGTISSGGHNLSTDSTCNFTGTADRNDTGVKLGPLQDNGGPCPTQVPLSGSPAIDAGDSAAAPNVDQRGRARPAAGNVNSSAIADIGATEFGDCNGTGVDDGAEIAAGNSADCDHNGIPDACELASRDCNTNATLDACENLGDNDADGIPDPCDQCPGINDLGDSDGDGVPDCKDGCPLDAAKTSPGACGCGVPESAACQSAQPGTFSDADSDGVADAFDNCPSIANADQADADSNGVGDACEGTINAPHTASRNCGIGICGGGAAGMFPTILLGLAWMKTHRRRSARSTRCRRGRRAPYWRG